MQAGKADIRNGRTATAYARFAKIYTDLLQRSSRLVWEDGSNWVDGVSHNFPAVPIPDGHLLKHHLTCAQRETLYLAVSRNSATFANLVWGNHPLAATLYEQNSFKRECGSTMRPK